MVHCMRCGTAQIDSALSCTVCGTTMNRTPISMTNSNALSAWENRSGSIFVSLFKTALSIFKFPNAFFSQISDRSKLGSAVLFYIVLSLITLPSTMIYDAIGGSAAGETSSFGAIVLEHVLFFILGIAAVFVGAALLQVLFMATGVKKASLKATTTAYCYSNAPLLLMLIPIPFVPIFVAAIWAFILQILSMAKVHRCSVGKMALIQIVPIVICTMLLVLLVAIIAIVIAATGISLADTLGIQDILELIR